MLGFLRDRKQRVIFGSPVCNWKTVNKGTTQGSVSGPYLFNIFLNDLEIKLGNKTLGFKYADDRTIIAPVYDDIDHSADLINQLYGRLLTLIFALLLLLLLLLMYDNRAFRAVFI